MIQVSRLFVVLVGFFVGYVLFTDTAWAETWSDKTGNFQIEAEFVGVQGSSVVLRKPDGNTVNVPIDRLSVESRAQAKRLYELARSGGGSPLPLASPPAPGSSSLATASPLNFSPPTPPTVPPMAPFPENASLQDTVDFVRAQFLAGHPEVVWYALPEDFRSTIDDAEFRNSLTPLFQQQAQNSKSLEQVAMKAIEVLVTKKQFLLNSALMAQVPPPLMPTVQQAYDPAVGLIYELSMLSFHTDSLADKTVTELFDDHGPRIGAHLQALAKMAPPGVIDQAVAQVIVEQTDDSRGTITVPDNKGGTETTEMVKYSQRWLPRDLAEKWAANKDSFATDLVAQMNAAKEQNAAATQQANMMVGMVVGMADGALGPMLAATTQQEFDQALTQVASMFGGMLPGGSAGSERAGGNRGGVEIKRTFKNGIEVEP